MKTKEDETSLVLNSISELVVFQDKEHNIKWVNQAAADSVGATRKELIGQKCHKVWHNIDIECEMCPVSIAITTGQPASGEIMDPLGRVFLLSGSPVRDENGNVVGLVEIGNDITVIKQAQQKSQENEIKFREAYNRSNFYKDLFAHDINNIFQNIQSAVDLFALSIRLR